jgi:hypothetical protein
MKERWVSKNFFIAGLKQPVKRIARGKTAIAM